MRKKKKAFCLPHHHLVESDKSDFKLPVNVAHVNINTWVEEIRDVGKDKSRG